MRYRGLVVGIGVVGLSASLFPCAGVFRQGEEAAIYQEKALIVWNPTTRTEHFIRKAWFKGKGADFGFLVPTPTEPSLGEASDLVFGTLDGIEQSRRPPVRGGFGGGGGAGGANFPTGVEVVKQQTVAGYKATVLRSNDTSALTQWLSANGYPSSPEIETWVAPYLSSGFYVTALKIDRKSTSDGAATAAIRISFRSPAAYYPYREPQRDWAKSGSRSLKVYFVSDSTARGTYSSTRGPWTATPFKVGDLSEAETEMLLKQAKLAPESLPSHLKMTVFNDTTVVRPNSDLFFLPE